MKYLLIAATLYFGAGVWACGSAYDELPIAALRAAAVKPFPACVDWAGVVGKGLTWIDGITR